VEKRSNVVVELNLLLAQIWQMALPLSESVCDGVALESITLSRTPRQYPHSLIPTQSNKGSSERTGQKDSLRQAATSGRKV